MKRIPFLILFLLPFLGNVLHGQSKEEILKAHFTAFGQLFWEEVSTAVVDGNWTTENFTKYPIKITGKRPDKIRIEGVWGGKKFVECWNGRQGWAVTPWEGTMELKQLDKLGILRTKSLFSFGSPLYLNREKLEFLGMENFQGELLLHFRFLEETISTDYYLGKEDYRLYWEIITIQDGEPQIITKQYEKYKSYQGLLSPTSLRIVTAGSTRELIFESVALGVGTPESLFDIPKK